MSGTEQIFFVIGVGVSIIGAIGFAGLLARQALEWWIQANDVRKPLMAFYADQLKKKHGRPPA